MKSPCFPDVSAIDWIAAAAPPDGLSSFNENICSLLDARCLTRIGCRPPWSSASIHACQSRRQRSRRLRLADVVVDSNSPPTRRTARQLLPSLVSRRSRTSEAFASVSLPRPRLVISTALRGLVQRQMTSRQAARTLCLEKPSCRPGQVHRLVHRTATRGTANLAFLKRRPTSLPRPVPRDEKEAATRFNLSVS